MLKPQLAISHTTLNEPRLTGHSEVMRKDTSDVQSPNVHAITGSQATQLNASLYRVANMTHIVITDSETTHKLLCSAAQGSEFYMYSVA